MKCIPRFGAPLLAAFMLSALALPAESQPRGQFVISDSNVRLVDTSALERMSDNDLWHARNEILARHGYIFTTERGRRAFGRLPYYIPRAEQVVLSAVEKLNIELIQNEERRRIGFTPTPSSRRQVVESLAPERHGHSTPMADPTPKAADPKGTDAEPNPQEEATQRHLREQQLADQANKLKIQEESNRLKEFNAAEARRKINEERIKEEESPVEKVKIFETTVRLKVIYNIYLSYRACYEATIVTHINPFSKYELDQVRQLMPKIENEITKGQSINKDQIWKNFSIEFNIERRISEITNDSLGTNITKNIESMEAINNPNNFDTPIPCQYVKEKFAKLNADLFLSNPKALDKDF